MRNKEKMWYEKQYNFIIIFLRKCVPYGQSLPQDYKNVICFYLRPLEVSKNVYTEYHHSLFTN